MSVTRACILAAVLFFVLFLKRSVDGWIYPFPVPFKLKHVINSPTVIEMITNPNPTIVRLLGSYEKLLARAIPNSDYFALSHSCTVIFNQQLNFRLLMEALTYSIARHPMLRVGILTQKGNDRYFFDLPQPPEQLASSVLHSRQVESEEDLFPVCHGLMEESLNRLHFPSDQPQFKIYYVSSNSESLSGLVFAFNHGIDDQQSLNVVIKEIIHFIDSHPSSRELSNVSNDGQILFPLSIEEGISRSSLIPAIKTFEWAIFQLINSLRNPVKIPLSIQAMDQKEKMKYNVENRKTIVRLFNFPVEAIDLVDQLIKRKQLEAQQKTGVSVKFTITHFLSAMMLYCTNVAILKFPTAHPETSQVEKSEDNLLRFLLSVGLRPYSSIIEDNRVTGSFKDFTYGTVACASGAVDFLVPIKNRATHSLHEILHHCNLQEALPEWFLNDFWQTVSSCAARSKEIIQQNQWVPESVRLFDIGMHAVDILQAVEIDAKDEKGFGRGYSCGVSNMGKVNFPVGNASNSGRGLKVESCFYGTSHHRNGVLCQLSCMTTESGLHGCFQFPFPLITEKDANVFQNNFKDFLNLLIN